jgi:hypothetical protein
MDKHIASYISRAVVDILDSGFQLKFLHDLQYAGLCEDRTLTISTEKDSRVWFPAFVHEYCHFLQWKEKKFVSSAWDVTY